MEAEDKHPPKHDGELDLEAARPQPLASIEHPTIPDAPQAKTRRPSQEVGDEAPDLPRIGPYELIEVLGEGGMGTVYLAEQTRPITRQVALKLIRTSTPDPQILQRFEAERQALARMNDPYIAKVLEAGETEDGQPFIVMEYVAGLPITQACNQAGLSIEKRLDLFAKVCRGIHHAHQKGVLHRDVKPSNILVTEASGEMIPKIIDFGIAKALDNPLTEETLLTQHGLVFGTPSYLSPESIERSEGRNDVDIRSDVYSLGVLLYEILTGERPHGRRGDSVLSIINEITRGEIAPPSSVVRNLDPDSQHARARARSTSPQSYWRQLRGDLDWITLKATARHRSDRYGSAAELAAEIDRFRDNEPVLAGPPSRAYRARKFLRRHRAGVAFATVAAVALAGGLWARTMEAQRANREAEAARQAHREAEAVVDFLVDLFRVSDPGRARGSQITARELLDRGAERIEAELRDQPMTRARLLDTIGIVYRELGFFDPAASLLEESLELRRNRKKADPLKLSETEHELAMVYWQQGRYDASDALLEGALARRETLLGPDHLAVSDTLNDLASSYRIRGRVEEAEAMYRRALEIRESNLSATDPRVADTLHDLAVLCFDAGRVDEAQPLFEQALEIRESVLGSEHPAVAHSANGLAMVASLAGDHERAERLFRKSLAIREKVLGPDHADVAQSLNNLASDLLAQERRDEARPLVEKALAIYERTLGPEHYRVGIGLNNLADLLRETGRLEEAEPRYLRALAIFEKALGADHVNVAYPLKGLADIFSETGRTEEAARYCLRALSIRERAFGPDHEVVVSTRSDCETLAAALSSPG